MKRFSEAIPIALLTLLVIALYWPVTTLFWTWDDPFHLNLVAKHDVSDYLFSAELWRGLPFRMFTPLQMISYDADVTLFGFSPRAFYVHHLFSLIVATLAVYAASRLWLPPVESAAGAMMFAAGVPTISWAQQLMVRHYVEGLVFAAGALIAFTLAMRRESRRLAIAAGFLSLLAMLAKEVYVPVPLLLLVVREGDWRIRLKSVAPSLAALAIVLGWRFGMLGTLTGGYGWAVERRDIPRLLAAMPEKLGIALGGSTLVGGLVLVICFGGFVFAALRTRGFFVALALAVAPILPVSTVMERRYTALIWLIFVLAFVHACHLAIASRKRFWLIAIAAIALLVANRIEWTREHEKAARMSREARFYLRMPASDWLRKPLAPPSTMGELGKLKEKTLRAGAAGGWYADELYLCDREIRGRIWSIDSSGARDVTAESIAEGRRYCAAIRQEAALSVATLYSGEVLYWELGPYEDGRYAFIVGAGAVRYDMPAEAGFQIGRLPAISFRVKYESPAGWVTYSPELTMKLENGARLQWSRGR